MTAYFVRMWKEKKYRAIIILAHFLLSFVYERTILIVHLDKDVVLAEAMNYIVSDRMERMFGYAVEKMFAFLFIVAMWSIIWAFFDNFKKVYIKVLFLIWFAIVFIAMATYPIILDGVWDAFETYSYGIRFWPEYWHSAYSSLIFGGMLMVFPSPATIQILQPLFGIGAIGYLYKRIIDSPVLNGKGRGFVWLLALVPKEFSIFTSPNRMNQYATLSIFVFSVLVMDIVDKKERPMWEKCAIILMTGFYSVWRTEGIIIGLCAVFATIVFVYGKTKIEKVSLLVAYIFCVLLISFPQKLGDAKYYGKDYLFVSSFPSIYNILNDPAHDLSYEGVDEDMEAVSKIVPLDLLAYRGVDGYRRYNYAQGRADVNQSMAGKENSSNYMKAYLNLVLHNPGIYFRTQLSAMGASMGFVKETYEAEYSGGEVFDYPNWEFAGWSNGRKDAYERKNVKWWAENMTRQKMLIRYYGAKESVDSFFKGIHFRPVVCGIFLLLTLVVVIKEIVNAFRKKTERNLFGFLAIVMLMELFAIMLTMPLANVEYIQPTFCAGFIVLIAYFAKGRALKKA